MKSTSTYRRKISAIRREKKAGRHAEALAMVDGLLADWPGSSGLHVMRAELIQLQDGSGPALAEAIDSLRAAVDLDGGSPEALLEQGHYQFAVEDDAKAAAKTFSKAVDRSKRYLVAALLGQAAALEELGRRAEAFDALAAARWLQSSNGGTHNSSEEQQLLNQWESLSGVK